ncbi:MAG: two-component regulator propeller domain-containing protein [bacterium]
MSIARIISFLCLALVCQVASAQPIRFDHLSLEQGVSHNLVFSIHQDRHGLMWFGTMYGLVKYDGRQYTVYRHDPRDKYSISFNDVIAIYEDRQGKLWVGTWGGGLNQFDPAGEKFTRYLHDPKDSTSLSHNVVWAICEDKFGEIWIGTESGLDKLVAGSQQSGRHDVVKETFIHYSFGSLRSDNSRKAAIRAIHEDRSDRLWIGTFGNGLQLFDRERQQFIHFRRDRANRTSLSHNFINSIYEDKAGSLWIGTAGGGLNKLVDLNGADKASKGALSLNPENVQFVRHQHDPKEPHSLSDNSIGPIVEDRQGFLWVGTFSGGLNRFDRKNGRFTHYAHAPDDPYSLSSNNVVTLCEDRSGILWIGSYHGGVDKLDPHQYKFEHFKNAPANSNSLSHNAVRAIYQDRAGALWIGTYGGGLDKMITSTDRDNDSPRFFHYRADRRKAHGLRSDYITAITEDRTGTLWVGTTGSGLHAFDRTRRRFTSYQNDPQIPQSLSSNTVTAICEGHTGALWIGTEGGGLNRFDYKQKRFKSYQNDAISPHSLSNNFIHTIYEDRSGALWIGTYRGLNKFDRGTETFTSYQHRLDAPNSLSNDYVYTIYEDKAGTLWIGTSDGLNKFDPAQEKFKSYYEQDGLPNNVICGILEDGHGTLWISTLKGLVKFDPVTETFHCYDVSDGLQSNMFTIGAFFKNHNGEMFFGGINGFNRFHPSRIKEDSFVPPILVTALKIFDKPVSLATGLQKAQTIKLRHTDNFITFEFAALSYSHPERNQFAYKLEGVDRDWIYCGSRNTASYTGLPHGNYVFRVKGANHSGVWNESGAALAIVIAPPFWRTWWFYGLVSAALVFAVLVSYRLRLQHDRQRIAEIERIKSEEKLARFKAVEQAKLEERERVRKQIAADFHDESGHKLTKISLFCGVLQSKLHNGAFEIEAYVNRIMQVAASLHKDMSDFIWSLDPEESTLHDTALKLKDFGDKLFAHTGICFRVQGLTPDLEKMQLSMEARQNLTCIFKEGMNNILKHAREQCKNVTCAFSRDNGNFSVTLLDDSQGFDPSLSTSGRGLRNMLKRAATIGGDLQIISRAGEGTIIKFTSPASSAEIVMAQTSRAEPVNGTQYN